MFVWRSKYDELYIDHLTLQAAHANLKHQWNTLVDEINGKGGRAFLNRAPPLTADDIKRLLMLCHPDKHGGKQQAVEMTQKLLALREAL